MKTTLYYFSGSGNSLATARHLAKELQAGAAQPMSEALRNTRTQCDADAVGFVFPLYYMGLPRLVSQFLEKLALSGPSYIFAVVTCGMPFGKALDQVDTILSTKNHQLNAGFYLPMPDNYLPKFNLDEDDIRKSLTKTEKKEANIITLLKNRDNKVEKSFFLIRCIYTLIHKYWAARLNTVFQQFETNEKCTACGLCARICPVQNIHLKAQQPHWGANCEQCLACLHHCPETAIEFAGKTQGKNRYHHPEISSQDLMEQAK